MTTERTARTREGTVREAINELLDTVYITEGEFSSLGMLITDAVLTRDEASLRSAHDGLRSVYGRYSARSGETAETGRLLGLVDVTYWGLRRLG